MQRIALFVLAVLVSFVAHAMAGPAPIVGGSTVRSKDWPDVVGVIGDRGSCTGTLIAPDVVLTAGHCIDIAPHTVVTHADDLADGEPGERLAVKSSRAYPDWEHRFDVAVIVLQRVARVKPRAIATACLANQQLAASAPVTIVGYGLIAPDASDANTRLHAARIAVTDPFCANAPGCSETARPNGEFAAGGRGSDSCFGDSGGPAYIDTPAGPAIVGVVSRGLAVDGLPCANGGIYTRADKVVSWIESVTNRDLERVACARPSDETDEADPTLAASDTGGCATSGSGGRTLVSGIVVLAFVFGARRARQRRPA